MSILIVVLSIKLIEVLYVHALPVQHWFSILHSQADVSSLAYLGYLEGTFPAGGKLVHAFPVKHPPKY
jgi:hypothetical protein